MSKNDEPKNKIVIPEDHKPPTTRRDFLKYGIIPFAAKIVMPGFLTQIILQAQRAQALGLRCPDPSGAGYIPFIVFDMAGGAGLPGNFLVGKNGGPEDMLKSYDILGWNPKNGGALDRTFGIPMAANNVSRLLTGIKNTLSPEAQSKFRMGTLCHFSQLDTSTNKTSALTLVSRAGLKGQFIQNGVGTQNSLSGSNSDVALKEQTLKPMFVQNVLDIQSAVGHGPAFKDFSDNDLKSLRRAITEMSASQIGRFEGLSDAKKLEELALCGHKANMPYGNIVEALDPRNDKAASEIYRNFRDLKDENAIFGSVVYNVLKGNTGPGAITIGGCDYHDGNSIRGDQKDQAMGEQIGRAVELAHKLKTPFFFQLITDGGVFSDPGTRDWRNDTNDGLTVIGFYDPNGAPKQRRLQVGAYTDTQAVNLSTIIGDDPAKAANVVLANYMSACGKIGEFERMAQGNFRVSEVDKVLIF